MKKNENKSFFSRYFWLLLTVIISLLPLTPLLHSGIFSGHDSPDHVARIANFYQNLAEGTLVPRWAGNLNWGYGHPILMFLYPLPSYTASLFIGLGFSAVAATKLVFALGFVGSGIAMFLWIRKIWGDRAGFIAGIFYLFAPYRFVDLYVRGAIGENFFFIFPPIVCYFLLKLFETKKASFISLSALSIAGMVLSHNALAIMFLPFILVYMTILVFQEKKKITSIARCLVAFILGFGLSSFFLIPAVLEGKYTLRDIVVKNEIFNRFETLSRLIYSPWSHGGSGDLSVQVGVGHWLVIIGTVVVLILISKNKNLAKKLLVENSSIWLALLSLSFFVVSLFLMLPASKSVYELITTLQKFQFPWRFLSLSVFTSAILSGFLCLVLVKKQIFVITVGIFAVLLTIPFWKPDGYIEQPESGYTGIYDSTTDTGESAPRWSVRFMERRPLTAAEIVEGEGSIEVGSRTSVRHSYSVEATSDTVRMVENTLYFPGWKVFVDDIEVPSSVLLFHDPNYRGLINFYINSPGVHEVVIKFTETKLRMLSNSISIISIILVVGLFFYGKK